MNKYILKMLIRSIKSSIGRYLAIFAIVALGIGFFTGVNNAEPSMQKTLDDYFDDLNMYDFSLVSTLGFEKNDVLEFDKIDSIDKAEGVYKIDTLMQLEDVLAYQVISLTNLAKPKLIYGNMPSNVNECVVDARAFSENDIGKYITITENSENFNQTSFKIVGLVDSPRFISYDRGSTNIGDGNLSGFVYILEEAFNSDIYHEIILNIKQDFLVFSDEYNNKVEELNKEIKNILSTNADNRYNDIKNNATNEIKLAEDKINEANNKYNQLSSLGADENILVNMQEEINKAKNDVNDAKNKLANLKYPTTYSLTLEENTGASMFKNDIAIVSSIAKVFPIFFILIVIFVCVTTMNRMVNDERVQIGTLKALGYSSNIIASKYILYVSTASFLGSFIGFFLGTSVIPQIIWQVYDISYGFSNLSYYFSPIMYLICLLAVILVSGLITLFSCYHELKEKPAYLIRPKAPNSGKRIIFEYINWFWNKLSFLSKVTIRNTFRYKKRMIMMFLGIGGCTALLVAGFGIKDSISNILDYQFNDIMKYDVTVSFDYSENTKDKINKVISNYNYDYLYGYQTNVTIENDNNKYDSTLIGVNSDNSTKYFDLHQDERNIKYPTNNNAVISSKLADILNINIGDTIKLNINDKDYNFYIYDICDNYLNNYVYINSEYLNNVTDNYIYIKTNNNNDKLITDLREIDGVNNVVLLEDQKELLEDSMNSLNYIVILIIVSAAALAFIVLYNLTNINIIERNREIATVKVLGFYSNETASYVLRENIILSIIGSIIGLYLGKLLHLYIMKQIQVEQMTFDIKINFLSYVLALVITIIFALISNFIMHFKLDKINMAESMKSVE